MRKILIRMGLFLGPILVVFTLAEYHLRHDNTYYYKLKYFEDLRNDAEVLFLGSSHMHRAIDPELLGVPTLNMANVGSAMDLHHKMVLHLLPELPKLKVLVLELSYQSLEGESGPDFSKNNLYRIYFGIDNYEGMMPLKDKFLLTSNPHAYIKKIWQDAMYPKRINPSGFMKINPGPIKSRFSYYSFDTTEIRKTSRRYLAGLHNRENLEMLERNVNRLREIQNYCHARGIQLIFMSPPKYYLYNEAAIQKKLERRDSIAHLFGKDGVPFWNFERSMEYEARNFQDENHLNPDGATAFTRSVNKKIMALPEFSPEMSRLERRLE